MINHILENNVEGNNMSGLENVFTSINTTFELSNLLMSTKIRKKGLEKDTIQDIINKSENKLLSFLSNKKEIVSKIEVFDIVVLLDQLAKKNDIKYEISNSINYYLFGTGDEEFASQLVNDSEIGNYRKWFSKELKDHILNKVNDISEQIINKGKSYIEQKKISEYIEYCKVKFEKLYNCGFIDDILLKEKINQMASVILGEINNYIQKNETNIGVSELTNIRLIVYMMESFNFTSKECHEIITFLDTYLLENKQQVINDVIGSNKAYQEEIENRKTSGINEQQAIEVKKTIEYARELLINLDILSPDIAYKIDYDSDKKIVTIYLGEHHFHIEENYGIIKLADNLDQKKFLQFYTFENLLERISVKSGEEIQKHLDKEYITQHSSKEKLASIDLPKNRHITHYCVYPQTYDEIIGSTIIHHQLINNLLNKSYNIEHKNIFSNNPLSLLENQIKEQILLGNSKDFLLDLNSHGYPGYLDFPNNPISGKDLVDLFKKVLSYDSEVHITVNTIACFGGGIIEPIENWLREEKGYKERITIFTQTDPKIPQEAGKLYNNQDGYKSIYGTQFTLFFFEGLENGLSYSAAMGYADSKMFELKKNNPKFLINGEIVDGNVGKNNTKHDAIFRTGKTHLG